MNPSASATWTINEDSRRRFERSWREGRPEPIEAYLPAPSDPLYLGTLRELVLIDMEFRWRNGETSGPPVEEYLSRFPILNDSAALASLVREEARLRLQRGQPLSATEWQQRFPQVPREEPPATLPRTRSAFLGLPSLPGYEVLSELGRGGMGVVFRARQVDLDRIVAVKMLLGGGWGDEALRRRFQAEAEAIARLQHPNIVQVFGVGEHEGRPYLVLEYIEGKSLAQVLGHQPQPAREAARLVAVLARAVQHAHERGIVHRDLKPGNVLLSAEGREASGERSQQLSSLHSSLAPRPSPLIPKITDFGLARRIEEEGQTRTGDVVGTPAYMAPEQVDRRAGPISPATDIWALGVILYEMLVGRPPFQAEAVIDVLWQIRSLEPVPPSRLVPRVPRDLETICLKCLHKEPARRYGTAQELADDLARFESGEPIRARPTPLWERGLKWARRRPAVAGLILAGFLGLTGAITGGVLYNVRVSEARHDAELARDREQGLRRQAEGQLYLHALSRIDREWFAGNYELVGPLLEQCEPRFRGWEWRAHQARAATWKYTLPGAQAVAVSPDGKWLVTDGSVEDERRLALRRLSDGKLERALADHPGACRLAFSSDGRLLAAAGSRWSSPQGVVYHRLAIVWEMPSGREIHRFAHSFEVLGASFSPDGTRLAVVSSDRLTRGGAELHVWDLKTAKPLVQVPNPHRLEDVIWSPDGQRLLTVVRPSTGSSSINMQVRSATTGEVLRVLRGPAGSSLPVAVQPQTGILALGTEREGVQFWDPVTDREAAPPLAGISSVSALAYSRDGRYLSVATHSLLPQPWGGVQVWDLERRVRVGPLREGPRAVTQAAISPDARLLLAGSRHVYRSDVTAWDLTEGIEAWVLGHSEGIYRLAFNRVGDRLATGEVGGKVRLWDLATGQVTRTLAAHDRGVAGLALSPDSKRLATIGVSPDFRVKLWDTDTGRELFVLEGHKGTLSSVVFSPDGRRLFSSAWDRTVRVWDVAQGKELTAIRTSLSDVTRVGFSPDGKTLHVLAVAVAHLSEVTLYDAETLQERYRFRGQDGPINDIAFHPGGEWIVSAAGDGRLGLWKADSGRFERTLVSGGATFAQVLFLPDGKLVTRSNSVEVWDIQLAQRLLTLRESKGISALALHPSGEFLVIANGAGTLKLWPRPAPGESLRRENPHE